MFIPEIILVIIILGLGLYFYNHTEKMKKAHEENIEKINLEHKNEVIRLNEEIDKAREEVKKIESVNKVKEISALINVDIKTAESFYENLNSNFLIDDFNESNTNAEKKRIIKNSESISEKRKKRISFINSVIKKNNLKLNEKFFLPFEHYFDELVEGEKALKLKDLKADEKVVVNLFNKKKKNDESHE